jgi:hypothetical protein
MPPTKELTPGTVEATTTSTNAQEVLVVVGESKQPAVLSNVLILTKVFFSSPTHDLVQLV